MRIETSHQASIEWLNLIMDHKHSQIQMHRLLGANGHRS